MSNETNVESNTDSLDTITIYIKGLKYKFDVPLHVVKISALVCEMGIKKYNINSSRLNRNLKMIDFPLTKNTYNIPENLNPAWDKEELDILTIIPKPKGNF